MLSKEKAMYQTWLIIEGLPHEEKSLISVELLDEIQNTMEQDDSIKIDFSIPLEKQELDTKTWSMLNKIMKSVNKNGYKKSRKISEKYLNNSNVSKETSDYKINEDYIEKIKLENTQLLQELSKTKENVRVLITGYKKAYEDSKKENVRLRKECENEINKLKQSCNDVIQMFDMIPRIIRRIFVKDEKIKMLRKNL